MSRYHNSATQQNSESARAADAQTLRARGYASDFVGAFLTMLDASSPSMSDDTPFPFEEEAVRMYLTLIELGKRAEIQAAKNNIAPGAVRSFHCADYIAELHYQRRSFPFHLLAGLEGDEKERKAASIRNSLGKLWRRRWARVIHDRQRRNHLGFFVREKRENNEKKKATVYVDRLSDLVSEAALLIRGKKGVQVKRAALAVREVLARFNQTSENVYAPDWTEPEASDEAPESVADAPPTADDADPFEPIRKNLRRLVKDARAQIAARDLSEDEADQVWLELHALMEAERTESPRPLHAPRKRAPLSVRPSVLSKRDTPENAPADWLAEIVTPPAANTSSPLAFTNNLEGASTPPLENDRSQFFAGNLALAPERGFPKMECSAEAARLTVEAMQSVGADRFKIVYLGCVPVGGQAECVGSEEIAPAALLSRVGELVTRSAERGQSVTLRAWGGRLIQIDDCTPEVMRRLLPFAFLVVETSPGNFQVWLALSPDITDEARKDVRGRLLRKFAENSEGANGGAFNSLRLPGCLNAKEKYRQSLGHFPRVALTHVELGRTVAPLELEQAGLLAAPVEKPKPPIMPTSAKLPTGALPDYNNYLADAGGDRSRADIRWAMAALGAGFPHYAVIAQLETLSGKAQCRRDDYTRKTVEQAAVFVAASSVTKAGRERVTL
jgi:hypothetical protein